MFLIVLEAEESKAKVPGSLVPGEGSFSAFQPAVFLLCPHMTSSLCMWGWGGGREGLIFLLIRLHPSSSLITF